MLSQTEIEILGYCAFCKNSTHDFQHDEWHEAKHDAGWHACKVLGGFRQSKPLCRYMEFDVSEVGIAPI